MAVVSRQQNHLKHGVLEAAVLDGKASLSDAASVAKEPEDVQAAAVEAVRAKRTNTLKKAVKLVKRDEHRKQAKRSGTKSLPANLYVCDIADLREKVEAGSVDAIVTDPPYGSAAVSDGLFHQLGEYAKHALKPGGLCLVLTGQHQFGEKLQALTSGGMQYRWLLAYTMPNGSAKQDSVKITNRWKPWIALTAPGGNPTFYSTDLIESNSYKDSDKFEHEWSQSEAGVAAVIQEWVRESGSVICDPFCGAGSTLTAAAKLGHSVIGADVDPTNVELTRRKLSGE